MRLRVHSLWLFAALAAFVAVSATPAATRQISGAKKEEAAAGPQTSAGSAPFRVMLVIGDDVRDYKPPVFLGHYDFGPRLAKEAERVCRQSFTAVTISSAVPADPHAFDAIDLVILVQSPVGTHLGGLFTFTQSLSAIFVVHNTRGEEIFRVQENDTEKGNNLNSVQDRLGEGVTRKFIQDLLLTPNVRNLLSPHPAAPVEAKPVLADTAAMDSAGLDVPPPPPWGRPGAAPTSAAGSGRP